MAPVLPSRRLEGNSTENSAESSKNAQGFETDSSASDDEGDDDDYKTAKHAQDGGKKMTKAQIISHDKVKDTTKVAYRDTRYGPTDQLVLADLDTNDREEVMNGQVINDMKTLVLGSKVQHLQKQRQSNAKIARGAGESERQAFWTALSDEIAGAVFSYGSGRKVGTSNREGGFQTPNGSSVPAGVQALED